MTLIDHMNRRRALQLGGAALASASILPNGPSGPARAAERVTTLATEKTKLMPKLVGDWWLIGPAPDLDHVLPLGPVPNAGNMEGPGIQALADRIREAGMSEAWVENMLNTFKQVMANRNEPVDHHIFQDPKGIWHLWGCVRQTSVGRVLYHWRTGDPANSPWEATGEIMRCDQGVGECLNTTNGEEVIQSPYFVKENGLYYMFYGGLSTGLDAEGKPVEIAGRGLFFTNHMGQICLMTSKDGITWTRHRDAGGHSRVFSGPSGVRDPCLIKVGGTWIIYYAAYEGDIITNGGCFARTSKDLIHWSDYKLIHRDASHGGPMSFTHECPHVVYRGGYFYLFRTENYYDELTHVYRSLDPMDFGVDTGAKYVTTIACGAPELYTIDGGEYVSSNHDPKLGTQMSRLVWVEA